VVFVFGRVVPCITIGLGMTEMKRRFGIVVTAWAALAALLFALTGAHLFHTRLHVHEIDLDGGPCSIRTPSSMASDDCPVCRFLCGFHSAAADLPVLCREPACTLKARWRPCAVFVAAGCGAPLGPRAPPASSSC